MVQVVSTAVDRVNYDSGSKALDIWYKGGGRYRYLEVPPLVYRALLGAPSIGAFVNENVKPCYRFRRMS